MASVTTAAWQSEIQRFLQVSLRALVRAETDGRLPVRFTSTGKDIWNTFRNELSAADLVGLCIQDAGVTMPVPFDPSRWWPDWPDWALMGQSPADAERWINETLVEAGQPRDGYLRQQAAALGVEIPPSELLEFLPTPPRHERWLELPGTGGVGGTTPVGAYPRGASPYELLDMAGNVWEWCSSLYRGYPYRVDDGREDLEASGSRAVRGGSWDFSRYFARCAYRVGFSSGYRPGYRFINVGFRVVVSPILC